MCVVCSSSSSSSNSSRGTNAVTQAQVVERKECVFDFGSVDAYKMAVFVERRGKIGLREDRSERLSRIRREFGTGKSNEIPYVTTTTGVCEKCRKSETSHYCYCERNATAATAPAAYWC
jgi:hypothetical protein